MSAGAAFARIEEIRTMLGSLGPGGAAAPARPAEGAANGAFAQALQASTAPAATAASVPATAVGGATPFAAEIEAAAGRHGVDPALLKALIRQESGFNPNARSHAGASGLTQLMPGTAAGLGVSDPTDPAQAIEGGAKYLRQQLDRFGGDVRKALAAYNAGPGAVARYGGVPPYAETQNYVKRVLGFAAEYGMAAPSAGPTPTPSVSLPYSTV